MECLKCHQRIPALRRGDSRFCSGGCRVAWHRNSPPKTLTDIARWVRWSSDKVPLTIKNNAASSTNPSTWTDYQSASSSDVGVGVGFVLSDVDRIVCVDVDDCLDDRGRLRDWARDILADVPSTFIEVSPSKRGLHVWGFGDVVKGRRMDGVEIYGSGRYITVTGKRWRHSVGTFSELGSWIDRLIG